MKAILLISITLLSIVSFAQNNRIYKYNKKKISDKNYFYMFDNKGGTSESSFLRIVKPSRPFWGSIKEDGSIVIIKQDSRDKSVDGAITWLTVDSVENLKHATGIQLAYVDQAYVPEIFYPKLSEGLSGDSSTRFDRMLRRVRYRDYKFILQAMSVPLKFRKPTNDLPYQAEAGVNISFGAGLKWSYNWYAANKSFFGQKTNSVSFIPGVLVGLGAADIKGGTTAPTGFKDRKEPVFSYGAFFMFGFNNVNIGFVIGEDVALKDGGKAGGWYYNHKTWTGLAIGLDIIK